MTRGEGGIRRKERSGNRRKEDVSPEEGNHHEGVEKICQRRFGEIHQIASEGNHQIVGSTIDAATTGEALIGEMINATTIESLATSDKNHEHLKSDATDRGAMRENESRPVVSDQEHLVRTCAIRSLKRRNTEIHHRQSKN